ncbi:hypothetical protein ANCCAN_09338 [Ancylostoma caninum]|uniref:G-protein coupled receptors family 1 profile domain-containing protein n=1 Tax=Ancylostoma caninum TaxID=29170 RepID=A0A368GJY7_ANCCA|nr:hypothetical protein ANCCAN_09338 [Ancylostoma caninum]
MYCCYMYSRSVMRSYFVLFEDLKKRMERLTVIIVINIEARRKPLTEQTVREAEAADDFRMQAMSRHKYIYVIGTVLIVDLLFLCPYSGIQLVAFLHINHLIEITHSSTLIRWWLQVFIGVHSVCQPLCYFRMTEFRRLACCTPRTPWNKSKSYSTLNKSYGSGPVPTLPDPLFIWNILTVTRSVIRDDDLTDPPESPQINKPLLTHEHRVGEASPAQHWRAGESVRVRAVTNGTQVVKEGVHTLGPDIEMAVIKKSSAAF